MPHSRQRAILPVFKKMTAFWPVVGVLGPRQAGKSTFLRELAWPRGSFTYETLDQASTRSRAQDSPELFLKSTETFPLVVDEAQKAPALFDEIKAIVDRKRVPGHFVLSGSVQFSKKAGIRESLTGRMGIARMDTMTLSETITGRGELKLKAIERYLKHGGMPGVCFGRDGFGHSDYWEQWLDAVCERDLRIYGGGRLSGDLARRILTLSSTLELPNIANMARELRVDARRVQSHLGALKDLFVVRPVEPDPAGVGKTIYLPFDCGMATHLGAGLRRRWQIWFLVEWYNQRQFRRLKIEHPRYYLTTRGSFIDFVTDDREFHLFSDLPAPDRRMMMTLAAATKRFAEARFNVYCATEHQKARILSKAFACPWAAVVR